MENSKFLKRDFLTQEIIFKCNYIFLPIFISFCLNVLLWLLISCFYLQSVFYENDHFHYQRVNFLIWGRSIFVLACPVYIDIEFNQLKYMVFIFHLEILQDFWRTAIGKTFSSQYMLRITINRNFNIYIVYTAVWIMTVANPYGDQIYWLW